MFRCVQGSGICLARCVGRLHVQGRPERPGRNALIEQVFDELVAPLPTSATTAADPWVGLDLSAYDPQGGGQNRGLVTGLISRWMVAMATMC